MPRVQASIVLPYRLKLESAPYPTGSPGRELEISEVGPRSGKASTLAPLLVGAVSGSLLPSSRRTKTMVALTEDLPDTLDPDEQSEWNARLAERLLLQTNRLLRIYRAITRNATFTELSRAEASPFRFGVIAEEGRPTAWRPELVYQASPPKAPPQPTRIITGRLRDLMASGGEPDVADLFLLDAELAIHEGRFREAVLFCWSTIDSTFNRKYDQLVDARLAGEWSEARSFFTGLDFRLRNKMSAALDLIAGRSLFREPGDLWQKLSMSYNKRNGIIHRGENANENDSRLALEVARRVVEIMDGL
jgi:hypothetical protein